MSAGRRAWIARPRDRAGHPHVPQFCESDFLRQAQRGLARLGVEDAKGPGRLPRRSAPRLAGENLIAWSAAGLQHSRAPKFSGASRISWFIKKVCSAILRRVQFQKITIV